MEIKAKPNCPLNNFEECRQLECAWFMKINGHDPNTGSDLEEWGCSMAWLPVLLIENAQQSRGVGAALESFRNEVVSENQKNRQLEAQKQGVLGEIKYG